MLIAVAFLPLDEVSRGFRLLCRSFNDASFTEKTSELLDYFAKNFVGTVTLAGTQK